MAKLKNSISEAPAEEVVATVHETRSFPPNLPAWLRNHACLLIHNAVPIHDRLKYTVSARSATVVFSVELARIPSSTCTPSAEYRQRQCPCYHTPDQSSIVCLRSSVKISSSAARHDPRMPPALSSHLRSAGAEWSSLAPPCRRWRPRPSVPSSGFLILRHTKRFFRDLQVSGLEPTRRLSSMHHLP